MQRGQALPPRAGSMLAEVALAAALLALVVAGLMDAVTGSLRNLAAAERRTVALNLARSQLEEWRAMAWADLDALVPAGPVTGTPLPGYTLTAGVERIDGWRPGDRQALRLSVRVEYQPDGRPGRTAAVWLASIRGRDG